MNFGAPNRAYERLELVPSDYFRHLTRAELPGEGIVPLEIDLGCGDGSFLIDIASHLPERQFLGVERLLGRVRKVARKAERAGLANLQVLRLESAYTIGWILPDACISRVHLLFPDPWPKKRHHKNRFVQPDNIASIKRILSDRGEFLFKTDHEGYFEWVKEVMHECKLLTPLGWEESDFYYPETDFERQWKEEGRKIYRARFGKNLG
ncbi:MAG: tRNA (guanosine(46)-N7)-methyltransferase TrmB [Verrucomicrobiae bacterium]|nr:tRNA (guanosine(46)-N7)-methyltransferase TrmB [Verrucomicrobiae bacterium]